MGSDQKRAISAVIISGIILFGWQYYFAPKPVAGQAVTTTATTNETTNTNTTANTTQTDGNKPQALTATRTINSFSIGSYQITLSNFLEIIDLKSNEATNTLLTLFGTDQPVFFNLEAVVPNFIYSQQGDTITGIDSASGVKVVISRGDNSRLIFEIISPVAKKISIQFKSIVDKDESQKPRSFLAFDTEVFRHTVDNDKREEGLFKWYALEYKYDVLAIINHEKPLASFVVLNNQASYNIAKEQTNYKFDIILAKKNYDKLLGLGDNLDLTVDFGILGILAVPILRCLQFFYNHIPNYGWSIILVTILLRIVTFPLQYKSFKSMKKMQVIQPQLAKLKEKHKDNPQAMQKETMELFKKAGANPLGGCLPLLLQMPFFFAIWKVLSNAVELDGAPFHFWITNLTAKDPFYVLPVLMGASMFMQQKLSPQTATDPVQQKVLMFMPLIFAFIMKDLPSGLVLYMIVSTTVGILQQMIVYKTVD
jgi:YidC/Oxa1 family membrane protein insertase